MPLLLSFSFSYSTTIAPFWTLPNCYDNALAENFFSILKSECIYRQKLDSFDQARLLIDQYIHFYNYEPLQLKTRLTPFEMRRQAA